MIGSRLNLRAILGCLGLLLLAWAISMSLYGFWLRSAATCLLADLTALKVGQASAEDAERFATNHRKFFVNKDCKDAKCEYSFSITNHWLSAFHLEPDARFVADLSVENGTIVRIGAALLREMEIYPSFGASAGIVSEYPEMPDRYAPEGHYGFPTPIGKPYLHVVLDRHADAVQRQHAFAFSFNCLTKPGGGCDLSCDYLPLAWRDWRAELQSTGFPMNDFDQVYRNNSRCR